MRNFPSKVNIMKGNEHGKFKRKREYQAARFPFQMQWVTRIFLTPSTCLCMEPTCPRSRKRLADCRSCGGEGGREGNEEGRRGRMEERKDGKERRQDSSFVVNQLNHLRFICLGKHCLAHYMSIKEGRVQMTSMHLPHREGKRG